jgi:hypothetical protein
LALSIEKICKEHSPGSKEILQNLSSNAMADKIFYRYLIWPSISSIFFLASFSVW